MKNVLKGIEPERVLYFFEEMSNIVRGSSYEKPMSDYLVAFAKDRGYEVFQDRLYNVFIKVPGAAGGENAKPVVLHGHMDMVWNVADGVSHDFFKEPLDLYIEDGFLKARGTTLGADNGIGVAYMMALMDTDKITHPPLECVITVMEEMGKKGLQIYDTSKITAKRMIDFNWIDDKQILAGCSGDVSLKLSVPAAWEAAPTGCKTVSIQLSGLKGGHCEWDIHAERANGIILMARLLDTLLKKFDIRIAKFDGGVQNNVIPAVASAEILVPASDQAAVLDLIQKETANYKKEYEIADPGLSLQATTTDKTPDKVMGKTAAKQLVKLVHLMPNGLLSINLKVANMKQQPFSEVVNSCGGFPTETDNNLGILRTEGDEIWMITTITCAVTSRKNDVVDKIKTLAELVDAKVEAFGVDAPEFPYDPNSEMVRMAEEVYKESYGYEPQREVNCCSLQLGMLIQKCGLDCVGIGTEIYGVHAAGEKMSLESVAKTWKFVQMFMKKLSQV
jgi:dipeptidase D